MQSSVVSVRLGSRTRKVLSEAAKRRGLGISEYLRKLAEANELALLHQSARSQEPLPVDSPSAFDQDPWEGIVPPWDGPLPESWTENL